jgi:hypothetical protein
VEDFLEEDGIEINTQEMMETISIIDPITIEIIVEEEEGIMMISQGDK